MNWETLCEESFVNWTYSLNLHISIYFTAFWNNIYFPERIKVFSDNANLYDSLYFTHLEEYKFSKRGRRNLCKILNVPLILFYILFKFFSKSNTCTEQNSDFILNTSENAALVCIILIHFKEIIYVEIFLFVLF